MKRWVLVLVLVLLPSAGVAQVGMPDPRQMSGVPLPSPDLPVGTITVRVVRGSLSNNIPNQKVEILVGSAAREATTDASGRAEFSGLKPGSQIKASTSVDGSRIESQVITMPAQGGVRVMLFAPDAAAPALAPIPGVVVFGGDSRFIIERGDESLNVFYVLEIVNTARAPAATQSPLIFDLPSGAIGVSLLEGSTKQATVSGSRVTVTGPFASGKTPLHIAYELPYRSARVTIEQDMPAAIPDLAVAGETSGGATMTSPLFTASRDMSADGRTFKVGNGPAIPAGGTLTVTFDKLPHRPRWPRFTALGIAIAIMAAGLVVAFTRPTAAVAAGREALLGARNAHLQALAELEARHRRGAASAEEYASERTRLVSALEDIYTGLDAAPQQ